MPHLLLVQAILLVPFPGSPQSQDAQTNYQGPLHANASHLEESELHYPDGHATG
jgi:hypothetical protein